MIRIIESSGYHKMNHTRQQIVDKACDKLETQIKRIGKDEFSKFMMNNPVIHDSYGNFYVYKFSTKSYSVRLLYLYDTESDTLEIHRFHFKKGDRDNSKYIEGFEEYASQYSPN